MSLKFETSEDSIQSIENDIGILINLIGRVKDDTQRTLFIKVAIVLLVTKLQVFVENILDEFLDILNQKNIKFNNIPFYLRLTSIKVGIEKYKLKEKLANSNKYKNNEFANDVKRILHSLNVHFTNDINRGYLQLKSKFPLGKTGTNELRELFNQINGDDIFAVSNIDDNKLNSLLNIRHNVIHKDVTPGLTEKIIIDYKEFLIDFISKVDGYLNFHLENILKANITLHRTR